MIYNHRRRLIVQESGGTAKYTLPVVSANTDTVYPFAIPTAPSIEVISGNGIYDYLSGINIDDIVRLQVSDTYSEVEKDVFLDLFEGRIMDIQSNFGQGNTAKLLCVGHENATSYTSVPDNYAVTATDAGTIAQHCNYFLERIQISVPVTPTFNMDYSVTADRKMLKDVLSDIEKASGYGYFFSAAPKYNSSLNLASRVEVEFRQMPSTPVTSYAVTQGAPGLLYANFTVTGKGIYNNIIYYGATPAGGGAQYEGDSTDEDSADKYDTRTYVGTDNSFNSSAVCGMFANGQLIYSKDVQISGTAILMGTPWAKICDLVPIKIGDIDVNGISLNTNQRSVRVTHDLPNDNFLTTLKFGRVEQSPSDYIGQILRDQRLTNNMIK